MWDGTITKELIVPPLTIDTIDTATDIASGHATPSSNIFAWGTVDENYGWGSTTADETGSWSYDFSSGETPLDVINGTDIVVTEIDSDDDEAMTFKRAEKPMLRIYPEDGYLWAFNWYLGSTLTLTIDDPTNGEGIDYTDTMTVTEGNPYDSSSSTKFVLNNYQLTPGQIVSVTDGIVTKTHVVRNLTVDSVNTTQDTVAGTSDNGTDVYGWACLNDYCGSSMATADSSGNWEMNFATSAEPADLQPGSRIYVNQTDEDGDQTEIYWHIFNPHFGTYPEWNSISGWEWTLGATVTVTVDDPSNGVGVDYTGTQTVTGSKDDTYFDLGLGDFDLAGGQLVTVTDGTYTQSYTVTNLSITDVSKENDTYSGLADPSTDVYMTACLYDNCNDRSVTPDPSGTWLIDYSTEPNPIDVTYRTWARANQYDSVGDFTEVQYYIDIPHFGVYPDNRQIIAWAWPLDSTLTLTIDDPSNGDGVDYTDSQIITTHGSDVYAEFNLPSFDLLPGMSVTITDGIYSTTHVITSLQLSEVNSDNDTMSGTADPNSDIETSVCRQGNCANRNSTADPSGNWLADYAVGDPTFDIGYDTGGRATQYDKDSNFTERQFYIPAPNLGAYVASDEVVGWNWPLGSEITLTIDDPTNGEGVDYTDSGPIIENYGEHRVDFMLNDFDLKAGQIVTLTDGITPRTHTVTNLEVTNVSETNDTVTGSAEAESYVYVYGCASGDICSDRETYAAKDGTWNVDFASGSNPLDLTTGSWGRANQWDQDGNFTEYYWELYNPGFAVNLNLNYVWSYDWPRRSDITLKVDDVVITTIKSDAYGNVEFDNVDIQPGQKVEETNGEFTKVHTTRSIQVTSVDSVLDSLSGTAEYGTSDFVIWGCQDDNNCQPIYPEISPSGTWTGNYTGILDLIQGTHGWAQLHDNENNYTEWYWQVSNPSAFNKSSPASASRNQPTTITLKWGASSGATAYYYCFDTTNDGKCTTWVNNGTATSKTLSGLAAIPLITGR
jgi:hypothetical protein